MTFDRVTRFAAGCIDLMSRFSSRLWRLGSRLAASRAAARLRDLPPGWHHAIRGASVALVLLVAGAAFVDRVIVAAGRRGPDAAAVELGPAPALAKLEAKKPFKAGATPQVIAIAGTNFQPGMTARLVSPMDTDVTTFPAVALEQLSPTSFQLRTPLEAAGTYEISVRTPDGQRSNTLTLTVRK